MEPYEDDVIRGVVVGKGKMSKGKKVAWIQEKKLKLGKRLTKKHHNTLEGQKEQIQWSF